METTFTCVEWLGYYKDEVQKIKDVSPFLSVLCIAAGIEYMGKLLRTDPLDRGDDSSGKFEQALKSFKSLNKYAGKGLYNLIRCGLAHRITVKENVILTRIDETQLDDSPIIINVNTLVMDFIEAVKDAQSKTDWENPNTHNPYVTINDESETGSTITMKFQ